MQKSRITMYLMQSLGVYLKQYRLLCIAQNLVLKRMPSLNYSTTVDCIDVFTYPDRTQKDDIKRLYKTGLFHDIPVRHFTETEYVVDVTKLSAFDIDNMILNLHKQNKNKEVLRFVDECLEKRVSIGRDVLKKLFRIYSFEGKVDAVNQLRTYCLKVTPVLHEKNGEFLHYLAKAQCFKGNSDKGLSILMDAYRKYENLRGLYRIIIKELIHDSVMNRSEASMVIFKKYVMKFDSSWNDSYPLVCLWHVCWKSDWFSDQMLANDLLDSSTCLQNIVKETASTLCLSILKEYNEDAATRLLQSLLKYKMMEEYANVLQILFNYKLRNRDMRGCTEILRNCEVLGINLPPSLQSQFIKLLIGSKEHISTKPTRSENFKLKF